VLSEAEAAAIQKEAESRKARLAAPSEVRSQPRAPGGGGVAVGAYNDFWLGRGKHSRQTSLIIDPPDGRLPPVTARAKQQADARTATSQRNAASWEDVSMYDRCITRGMPGAMMPGFYNHNYHILQTPNYNAIVVEMIHDARIIPIDGRAHLNSGISQWLGDSRGHWEGDTLVVETTNFNDKVFERSNTVSSFGSGWKLVERFRRVDTDTIDYQFTINDPRIFTKPWTVAAPMAKSDGRLFEYACHEGNYAMPHILSAARSEEQEAAQKK